MTAILDHPTDRLRAEDQAAPTDAPPAVADSLDGRHARASHMARAVEGTFSTTGQPSTDAQATCAGGGALLIDPTLLMASQVLDDLERTRIANENRLRQMTRTEADSDGSERGFGLDVNHPDVARLAGVVEGLAALEHQSTLGLQRAMRRHPLGAWVKAQRGIGEKQAARLLASIGDPYWNTLHDRPRTVSELWAYCGLHVKPATGGDTQRRSGIHARTGVAARRVKGQKANWSTDAKTRAYLVAVSCMKCLDSPYRAVYLARRQHTATTHPEWTDGHSHNDALRVTSKAILRDLWVAARDIHQEAS